MQTKVKTLLLLLLGITAVVFYACSKYKDPPPAQPDGRLNNPYCNDSKAVNFNWGFPGKPDNSVCIYPVDSFLGSWVLKDSVFFPSGEISGVQIRNLHFASTEDTLKTHMAITGWCSGSTAFYITAGKYKKAIVDTLIAGSNGQYLCNNADTLSGTLLYHSDTLNIDFTQVSPSGTTYHKGTAVRP